MNILLTGATGFLGSHLLPKLVERDEEVLILKRSFSDISRIKEIVPKITSCDIDKTKLEEIFPKNKIDIIIHLATDYGKRNNSDIRQLVNANVELPARLLELGTRYGTNFFINSHTSAGSRYTLYSATKNAFMEIAEFFAKNSGIKIINLVIEYMYGENDDNTKFIPYAIESILDKREIDATTGEQKRDFIYVKDVVGAYLKVLDKLDALKEKYTEFNIGTGQAISLRECIGKIEKILGEDANINWGTLPYRKNELFHSQANISRAEGLLGWKPEVSLEEGLSNTVNWYKNCKLIGKI